MGTVETRIEKTRGFLKELSEKSGESFTMINLVKKHHVNSNLVVTLRRLNLLTKSKSSKQNRYKYFLSEDIDPDNDEDIKKLIYNCNHHQYRNKVPRYMGSVVVFDGLKIDEDGK